MDITVIYELPRINIFISLDDKWVELCLNLFNLFLRTVLQKAYSIPFLRKITQLFKGRALLAIVGHIYSHKLINTHIHSYILIYTHTYSYTLIHTHIHSYILICHTYTYTLIHTYIHLNILIHTHKHSYIPIYTHT